MFQTDFQSQLKEPKQKRLLIAAVVVFVAVGIVVYRIFFMVSPVSPTPDFSGKITDVRVSRIPSAKIPPTIVRESDLKRIILDTGILKTPLFQELKTYSRNVPVTVIEQGNTFAFQKVPVATPVPAPSTRPRL